MINPILEKYLKSKYGENYDSEAQSKFDQASDRANVGNFASSVGDAIAGSNIGSNSAFFEQRRKDAKDETLGKIDRDKKSAMDEMVFGNQMDEAKAKADKRDPMNQRNVAWRASVKANVPELAKSMSPQEFDQLTIEDADAIMNPVKWRLEKEGRAAQLASIQGARNDAREAALDEKHRIENEKKADRESRLAVPGFERTGEILPKDEEAMKFRKATAVSDQLSTKLKRMRDLVKDNGSFEYGGEAGTEMESLATEIQLLGKSPELYELGVLAGPDLSLLNKITADPSSMSSLFTRDKSRLKQIDSQLSSIDQKLGTTAKSLGYAQNKKREKQIVKTQINKRTGQKRVVYDDGSFEITDGVEGSP